jgi:hypothetical protein
MYMHRFVSAALTVALLLLVTGCATTTGSASTAADRSADDTPRQFVMASASSVSGMTDDLPADACANPLLDPRDRTELRLVRSIMGKGDYAVPNGKYGVGPDELLRVDCASGQPMKIVRR